MGDRPAGGPQGPGRRRLRRLRGPAYRAALREYANTVYPVVPVQEPGRWQGSRKRKGEILFIDGRKLGSLIPVAASRSSSRPMKSSGWRRSTGSTGGRGHPRPVPGFCGAATVEQIREHGYALTPGRYAARKRTAGGRAVRGAHAEADRGPAIAFCRERAPQLQRQIESHLKEIEHAI